MLHCVLTDIMNTRKWEFKLSEIMVVPALKEKGERWNSETMGNIYSAKNTH